MKGFSNLLMIVSAFVVAPFLVYFIHRFIPSAYPWVPFAIVILFAGVLGIGFLRGAGFGLIGESDSTSIVIKAEGAESSIKLRTKDGREQVIKP